MHTYDWQRERAPQGRSDFSRIVTSFPNANIVPSWIARTETLIGRRSDSRLLGRIAWAMMQEQRESAYNHGVCRLRSLRR